MTYETDYSLPQELLELVSEQGLNALPEAMRILLNAAMQLERENYLQVEPYERSPQRRGHANGFKPKTLKTRIGENPVANPQVRDGGFYPQSLEKGQRCERALKLSLAEMYVQGVSTRKVASITEELCGFSVSSSQVSQAACALDSELQVWRERPLGETTYLWLDARYEKVRQDGQVRNAAVSAQCSSAHRSGVHVGGQTASVGCFGLSE